jgi:hypothetical protein
LNKELTSK